ATPLRVALQMTLRPSQSCEAIVPRWPRLQIWMRKRNSVCPTFFHSAATCLHARTRLIRESTKHEGRKPRASERHVVGCCEELAGSRHLHETDGQTRWMLDMAEHQERDSTSITISSPGL